ncbi:metallophosphoesterase [Salinadaptatus halalkaliphilus]|uniref:Metallophosphoesterase n=1 Tax=Salinadaptatus halalkaliphilus TaxID=2419781 RepID=A0A4S3TG58_9EURY|nr:metallophosphoesterase [Salinadaptatus halalkaliphilus]THE62812.1 metallophosphoesterase [Salinadaptatus halalkaliphilus]
MPLPDCPVAFDARSVYVPAADALVVADLHFGRGTASSVEAPLEGGRDVLERLETLCRRHEPATVVVAGDLLHAFDRVPRGVEDDLEMLSDLVAANDATLVVTPGNHDAMLEHTVLADVLEADRQSEYRLADETTVVCHGHEKPTAGAELYVVGHDHPALSADGRKVPCFLYGQTTYDESDVLVVPAFTRLARGATVNGMYGPDFQSPLVVDAGQFHPVVYDESTDESLWFPKLRACRDRL